MKRLQSFIKLYTTGAVITLTTALILIAVLFVLVVYESRQQIDISMVNPSVYNEMIARNPDSLRAVYPGMSMDQIQELLLETWTRPILYEPFTQFKERPYKGKYVNVDQAGFRHVALQKPWPPQREDYVIFVFGGSTTFGYGVSDKDTIPSRLMEKLQGKFPNKSFAIYNFGRAFYYSPQERILFEQLLANGFAPSMAIFVDGLNEYFYERTQPALTDKLSAFVDKPIRQETFTKILKDIKKNAIDLTNYLQEDVMHNTTDVVKRNNEIAQNYFANKRLITAVSTEYDVIPVFVWQPFPTYRYNNRYYLFADRANIRDNIRETRGYSQMHDIVTNNPPSGHFLWLADTQVGVQKPLYVDQYHYTAWFSSLIAQKITDYLAENRLISTGPDHAH